jgi:ribonucleoside-diphosphate reductase alpha subunit
MSLDLVYHSDNARSNGFILINDEEKMDINESVTTPTIYVIKRKGHKQRVEPSKILQRVMYLVKHPYELDINDLSELCSNVIKKLEHDISTQTIDEFTAEQAISMVTEHLDYGKLASRIAINNHHKKTRNSFRDKMEDLYLRRDIHGNPCPLISDSFYKFILKNQRAIEERIDYDRDYLIDYFGFKTLEKSYLMKLNGKVVERPQDLFMRIAIFVHMTNDTFNKENLELIFDTYDLYSHRLICQASPTMFNSGSTQPQLFSCFLLGTTDSQDGIDKTYRDMGKISKSAGGIGVHVSSYRATDSLIRSTNGPAAGLVPIMKVFNACVRLYNQGGKRPGHAAMYIEPHHPDIFRFLMLKRNHGSDDIRARSLFYALWLSDLFMERAENDDKWSLFCPDECPGLNNVWGDDYRKLYLQYEAEGRARDTVKARDILEAAYDLMKEQGVPYICFKDTANRYNMQNNVGIIRSSNLCSEILLYSDDKEYAVCCLGNIVLPNYVRDSWSAEELLLSRDQRRPLNDEFPLYPIFAYQELVDNTRKMVANLDKLLDKNYYPVIETARSAFRTRAIGIGVQGLADVFMKYRVPFESPAAADLNKKIFEAIYYGAISESNDICYRIYKRLRKQIRDVGYVEWSPLPAQVLDKYPALYSEPLYMQHTRIFNSAADLPKTVGAYPAYLERGGGHMAKGRFHWELYAAQPCGMFDWESLRAKIAEYGVRHSHVTAAMPTASTSQIMGYVESFEPYKSNIYMRKTQAGEFPVINKYLYRDLQSINYDMGVAREYLLVNDGSVQSMPNLPAEFKALYKTAYEMKMKTIISMARDRQPYVDQAQSMNLFFNRYTYDGHFYKCIMYAWKQQLKTGSYYIRTKAAVKAQNLAVDPEVEKQIKARQLAAQEEPEICTACQ